MGRNLDLDHSANKREAVIAAYVEELEEKRQKDLGRSLGDEPGPIEDKILVPDLDQTTRSQKA